MEFEFFDEEGSGLGPTLEYYSLVAQEVLKPDYKIWKKTDDGSLFPNCVDPMDLYNDDLKVYRSPEHKHEKKVEAEKSQLIFRMIGVAVARAILDERIIDLPFHPLFWDVVLDRVIFNLKERKEKLSKFVWGKIFSTFFFLLKSRSSWRTSSG